MFSTGCQVYYVTLALNARYATAEADWKAISFVGSKL